MTAKKSYNRFFIIFQEEDKGYGMGPDRPPTGYAKVETRNDKSKVTVYVQNLKPFESGDFLYKCYLISHQDNKDCTAYLGMMNIDDLGRGESSWETSAENAFDSKTSVDKFNGAAIVVENESLPGIIAPLAGYMSKEKFDWRSRITSVKKSHEISKEDIPHVDAVYKEIEESQESSKFEEYENNIKAVEDNKIEENGTFEAEAKLEPQLELEAEAKLEPQFEADTAPYVLQQQDIMAENIFEAALPDANNIEDEDIQPIYTGESFDESERSKNKEHKEDKEHKYPYSGCMGCSGYNYRQVVRKMLEDILEGYEKMDKHKELKDCNMWKVDMGKYMQDGYKTTMYPCYDLVFYPMMQNPYYNYIKHIRKHGHYIFGIKHDGDGRVIALIYGIPGRKMPYDQPLFGTTGFTKWIPFNDSHGYWIMMYDPMTGIIMTNK